MSIIDNRIVRMEFDNSKFEKGIKESTKSLDELNKSLKLENAANSLEELQEAGDNFTLEHIANAADVVAERFSAMGIIGMRVLQNLTDSAISLGTRMVKSLSIDQISSGFSKYENETKAVQTIVNATGLSIEEVSDQLERLAWYTDETSYSFIDMVGNIGKFTSMNIPLDKSVTAMEGIANWAAASGQGVQEASRAMYNLSQAMGAGAVKLMDWKSIEGANMATAEFKQTAIDVAIAMGTLKKGAKTSKGTAVTLKNFGNTLQSGWFTSDVLLEVLKKYGEYSDEVYKIVSEEGVTAAQAMEKVSGETMKLGEKAFKAAQEAKTFTEAIEAVKEAVSTGWMKTFKLIFGNYEEAKELWTDLANGLWEVFASGAEDRNALLEEWKELGGREDLLKGVYQAFSAIYDIITAVKQAASEIFPRKTAEELKELTDGVAKWGEKIKGTFFANKVTISSIKEIREELMETKEALENPFKKDIGIGERGDEVKKLQERLKELGFGEALGPTGADGIFGPKTKKAIEEFQKSVGIEPTGVLDKETWDAMYPKEMQKVVEREERVEYRYSKTLGKVQRMAVGAFAALDIFKQVLGFVGDVGEHVLTILNPLISAVLDVGVAFSNCIISLDEWLKNSGTFSGWLEDIKVFLQPFEGIIQSITNWLNENLGTQEKMMKTLGPVLSVLSSIYKIIHSIFRIASTVINFIYQVGKRVATVLSPIWNMLSKILNAGVKLLAAFANKFSLFEKDITGSTKFAEWLKTIDEWVPKAKESVEAFCDSILKLLGLDGDLESMDFNKILSDIIDSIKNFFGFGDVVDEEGASQTIIQKISGVLTRVKDWVVGLFTKKGVDGSEAGIQLDGYKLSIGLIGAVLALITGKIFQATNTIITSGKRISQILTNVKKITSGFKTKERAKNIDQVATAILKFAGAIGIIAASLYLISTLSWDKLAVGLTGLVVVMGLLIGSVILIKKFASSKGAEGFKSVAETMLQLSTAVGALAGSVLVLAQLSWDGLIRGLIGTAALLAACIVTIKLLSRFKVNVKEISGTIGLFVSLATALSMLTGVVQKLGSMSVTNLAKGIIGMGLVMFAISRFTKSLDGISIGAGSIAAILAISVALAILIGGFIVLTFAMKTFKPLDIVKGIIGMGVLVGAIWGLLKIMEKITPNASSVLSLLPIALALDLLIAGFIAMALTMKILSPMDIVKAIVGMAMIVLTIAGLMKLIEKMSPNAGPILALLPVALALDLVIAGFIAMGLAMKFATIEDVVKAIMGVGIVVIAIAGLMKLVEKITPSIGAIFALIPVAMALDIAIVGFIALALTMKRVSWEDIVKAIVSFTAIVGMLSIMSIALSKASPGIMGSVSMLIASVAMIGAMVAFALVLKTVKGVKTKKILSFAAGLSMILLAFGGLAVMAKIAGPTGILLAAGAILAIGVAIGLLIAAFTYILNLPGVGDFLKNGAEKIGEIIGSFTGAMKAAELKAFSEGMKGFEGIESPDQAGVENALACAQLLSDFSQKLPSNYSVGKIMTLFVNSSPLTTFAEDIAGFAKGFNSFSTFMKDIEDTDSLADKTTSVVNISECLNGLSESLTGSYKVAGIQAWFINTMPLTTFGVDITGFADAFNDFVGFMNTINVTDDLSEKTTSVVNISECLNDLSGKLDNSYKVSGIQTWFINTMPLTTFGVDITGFADGFNEFATMMSNINDVGDLDSKTTSMINISSSLNTLSSSLDGTYKVAGIQTWFINTMPLTTFGIDIAGFADGFNNFAHFMQDIQPTEELGEKVKTVVMISESLSTLAGHLDGSYKVDGIQTWFINTMPLTTFGVDISGFADKFNEFAKFMVDVQPTTELTENVKSMVYIAEALSGLAGSLNGSYSAGPIQSFFINTMPLTTFGIDINGFAEKFNSFAQFMVGINQADDLTEKTEWMINIANSLSDLSSNLNGSYSAGPIQSFFINTMPLTTFGVDINGFAEKFNSFAEFMAGINKADNLDENVSSMITIAESLSTLSENLPDSYNAGPIKRLLLSTAPLTNFGEDVGNFAKRFNNFAIFMKGVKDIDSITTKTTSVIRIANSFSELSNKLPSSYSSGRILTWFSKTNSPLKNFGTDMIKFSEKFNNFAKEMALIEYSEDLGTKTTNAVKIATDVANFLDSLSDLDIEHTKGILDRFFTGDTAQDTVFTSINKLAQALSDSSLIFGQLSMDGLTVQIEDGIGAVQKLAEFLVYLGGEDVKDAIGEAFNPFESVKDYLYGTDSIAQMINSFVASIDNLDSLDSVAASIQAIVDLCNFIYSGQIVSGEGKNTSGNIIDNLVQIIKNTKLEVDNYKQDFYNSGENLIAGLAEGVDNNRAIAVEAAALVAQKMVERIRAIFDEASPSKVTTQIGEYFSQGLANGVANKSDEAVGSAQDVANSMLSTTGGVLTSLSQLIADGINDEPVIRPILDLSGVQQSANGISGMFGNHSIAVGSTIMAGNIDAYGAINPKGQGGMDAGVGGQGMSDFTTAIGTLNKRMETFESAITNMKVVMDSGALVGQIDGKMDRRLGERMKMNRRGM